MHLYSSRSVNDHSTVVQACDKTAIPTITMEHDTLLTLPAPIVLDDLRLAVANYTQLEPDRIQLLDCQVRHLGSGDGMTSDVSNLDIKFKDSKTEVISKVFMIAKAKQIDTKCAKWWESMKLFEREVEFYEKLLPRMNEILKGSDDPPLPLPKIYYAKSGSNCIYMENLRDLGFNLCHDKEPSCRNALDFQQVIAILKELARFHALTYHMINKYPGGMNAFKQDFPLIENAGRLGQFMTSDEKIVEENRNLYLELTKAMVPVLRDLMDDQELVNRFERSLPDLARVCGLSRHPERQSLCLVAHGDFWSNNILLKESEYGQQEIRIIDFQECMYTSPFVDVCCLLLTSVKADFRQKNLPHFLDVYYEYFTSALAKYGYETSSLVSRADMDALYKLCVGHGFYWGIINAWTSVAKDGLDNVLKNNDSFRGKAGSEQFKFNVQDLPDEIVRIISLIQEADQADVFSQN